MCSGITGHNQSYSPAVLVFNTGSYFYIQLLVYKQMKTMLGMLKNKGQKQMNCIRILWEGKELR